VGHGIGSVGGFAGRHIGLIKKKDKHGKEVVVDASEAGDPTPEESRGPTPGYDVADGLPAQPAYTYETNGTGIAPPAVLATPLPPTNGSDTPSNRGAGPSEPGLLTVTVVSARGLRSKEGSGAKPYVQLKMSGKIHKTGHVRGTEPEWCVLSLGEDVREADCDDRNETMSFHVIPGSSSLVASIHGKSSLFWRA